MDSIKGDEYGIGFTMRIPYDERDDVFTSVCYFMENILVKTFVSWQVDYHCISRLTTCSKNCMMKMIRDRKTKMRPHNTDALP